MDDLKLYAKNEKGLESLLQTVRIFSDGIDMEFVIDKRLYIPRKEGGRRLQGVEKSVKLTNLGLENYVKESRERLLTAARSVDIDLIEPIRETTIAAKKQKKKERTIS